MTPQTPPDPTRQSSDAGFVVVRQRWGLVTKLQHYVRTPRFAREPCISHSIRKVVLENCAKTKKFEEGKILCYYENMKNTKRSRTKSGTYTQKRGDTKIGTIEKKYGINLGVRPDMSLRTYLKRKGYTSLAKMLGK